MYPADRRGGGAWKREALPSSVGVEVLTIYRKMKEGKSHSGHGSSYLTLNFVLWPPAL